MQIGKDGRSLEGRVNVCAHYVTYRYWDAQNEITEKGGEICNKVASASKV